MSKVIIVTVGTSIYHSATWDENNENFRRAIGARNAKKYQERWCNPQSAGRIRAGLLSPSNRLRNAPELEENFHKWLKEGNPTVWGKWAAAYTPGEELRYSAELATLLKLAYSERLRNDNNWMNYFNDSKIWWICDKNTTSDSAIAAQHNAACLQYIASLESNKIDFKKIPHYSTTEPQNLPIALRVYKEFIDSFLNNDNHVEAVITGGYKIHTVIAKHFVGCQGFRMIFLHETFSGLFIDDGNLVYYDDERAHVVE
ncbi:MAG: hypothetical protein D6732_05470 [Methanobacteriota archaeon]|nr:MAG: hypothetical protein D6732_05470 [Euryarchaeota archaeon]